MRLILCALLFTSCVACQPVLLHEGGDGNLPVDNSDLEARLDTLQAALDAQLRLLNALIAAEQDHKAEVLDLLTAQSQDVYLITQQLENYNHNIASVYSTLQDLRQQIQELEYYKKGGKHERR